ncbi:helix-turn-helix domain-containing protein [Methylobacterium brachythecii]|uniref:HTH-type transcriptional regulator/antitoxin HipB n=1 Tax=Methylobacterium brachythecii TaxID=1176177 RepID=A0A7W6AQE3_9HYPH|nr:helix-turn-helix transcriptional regulator [Methylobacterium brachythecii]MBB3903947.1 HTH-type transcriptional regulator/antitoxin HipB [Methylobacterium brachythecii]GLS42693.1 hypothetical protein GCM10007884_06780 [Methylobacterium brachythecii]
MPKTLYSGRHKVLVECLVAYRKRAGMTQTELAKRLGLFQSKIAVMEAGGRRIDLIELLTIADILEFDIDELIGKVRAAAD